MTFVDMDNTNKRKFPLSKKTIAIASLPVLVLGWAAFRPELAFVNKTVNEKLPVAANATVEILSTGTFTSGAHETKGKAEIVSVDGKNYLKLSGFSTSNGPDVRVIGLPAGAKETSENAIDFGSIKGNIGDQNYELPSGVTPDSISNISIWCKRFNVGFGNASLEGSPKPISMPTSFQYRNDSSEFAKLASYADEITVTSGKFQGSKSFQGTAAIVETSGKRFVRLNFKNVASGEFDLKLVKKESLKLGQFDTALENIALGKAKKGKSEFSVPKSIDLWLYRSVAVVEKGKVISFVNLRSAQEKTADLSLAWI